MGGFRRTFVNTCVALVCLGALAAAKRLPPKPVSPVISDGIRYTAEGDGRDQYVVAADAGSGRVLWKVKVFHNVIKFWMEEDVQWVFITDLKLVDNTLLVRDEDARCYSVELKTRAVTNVRCGAFFQNK